MFCKQCSKELSLEAKFCNECGYPIKDLILPASITKRFCNHVIDVVITYIFVFVFYFWAKASSGLLSIIISFASFFVFFGYHLICEAIWQKTPGKLFTKTKVVDREGNKPSFLKILIRSLVRYIPFEPLSFLFGGYPIGWHDSFSKTLVVSVELTPEEVRGMNFIEIRKQKSTSKIVTVIIIIVAGLMVIAIIGLFASVVLTSLNSARLKGQDASVKANLVSARSQAELYWDSQKTNGKDGSYSGFCNSNVVLNIINSTPKVKNTSLVCNDNKQKYAIYSLLNSGGYWCIDNLGQQKIDNPLGTQVSCSIQKNTENKVINNNSDQIIFKKTIDKTTELVASNDWQEFTSKEGGFKVQFPGLPVRQDSNVKIPDSDVVLVLTMHVVEKRKDNIYVVAYTNFPKNLNTLNSNSLETSLNSMLETDKGNTLVSSKYSSLQGNVALDFVIKNDSRESLLKGKLVSAGSYYYNIFSGQNSSKFDDVSFNKFIDSFQLVK